MGKGSTGLQGIPESSRGQ